MGSLGSERGRQVNRGRLGRDVDQELIGARAGEVAKAEAPSRHYGEERAEPIFRHPFDSHYWFERTAARSYGRTTTVGR